MGSAFLAAALSLIFFCPDFWLWRGVGLPVPDLLTCPNLHRAYFLLLQLAHPWSHIPGIEASNNIVIEWRLLFPVLGHYLGMSPTLFFTLPHAGCVATLLLVAYILRKKTGRFLVVLSGTLLAATGSWFFVSTSWLGYSDSWLIFALVLVSFADSPKALFVTALLAPWVDERFVLSLPLCLGVRVLMAPPSTPITWKFLAPHALALVGGVAPYLGIRLGAELMGIRHTTAGYFLKGFVYDVPARRLLLGFWQGLRAGWIMAAIFFARAWLNQRNRWHLVATAGILLSFAVNLRAAGDLSRSASVAVPALIGGILLAAQAWPRLALWSLPLLGLANLLLPAEHVVADFIQPIFNLRRELALMRNPPHYANPNFYCAQGILALQHDSYQEARFNFDAAIALAPKFPEALASRGAVLILTGQPAAALPDLDRALALNPTLLDALLDRAIVRKDMGDSTGARTDLKEFLRLAPADWPQRKSVEELMKNLADHS
jgi:tetratricopeptide (TPR) repeat protein